MCLSKKLLSVLISLSFTVPVPLMTVGEAYAQTPRVYLDPTPLTLSEVGATGTIKVKLESVFESAGFQLELSFDNTIIQVESITLAVPTSGVFPVEEIDNEAGTVTFGAATFCDGGVCPNILSGSPLELATLTVLAIGEGVTTPEFDVSYTLYGVEMEANDMPIEIEAALTSGSIRVGEGSSRGATIELSSGRNTVVWPNGFQEFSSLSALESAKASCGGVKTISRKKNGWWESAASDYGGTNFALSTGLSYYITTISSCSWIP